MRKVKCALIIAVGITAIYFGVSTVYFVKLKPKSVNAVSKLGKLRGPLLEFYNEHQSFPTNLTEIGADDYDGTDMVSGKRFRYFPKAESGVLLVQPEPFRTMLWPLGEMHQYGMLTDGTIDNVYARRQIPILNAK
jgi:hypothetical protein